MTHEKQPALSPRETETGEETLGLDLNRLLPHIDLETDDCVTRLEAAILNLEGVYRVHRNDQTPHNELYLQFDPSILSSHDVRRHAEDASERLRRQYAHTTIPIEGMDCSDCAFVIKHSLEHVRGVERLDVSYPEQRMRIEFDRQQISQSSIESHVRRLGFDIPKRGLLRALEQNRQIIFTTSAGALFLLGWIGELSGILSATQGIIFYIGTYLLAGLPILHQSIQQLFKERRFDTDQLMIAAGIGAAILGEFAEGALLLFLFSLGHALEERALNRARSAIHSLDELVPKVACVRRGSEEEMIPVESIKLDDVVIVPPGARIPVDGRVSAGFSSVDQSSITGESIPVDVSITDLVYAGSVNGEGALEIATSRLSKDSTVARIIHLVEDAQATKSPLQRYSDNIIRYLVPSILVMDALLIIVPPLFGVPFRESFLMAMTLLVAASPCALALGTPSAILAGIARAAKGGVLVKGGAHLENLGDLKVIAFDKTGTLTKGELLVTDIVPFPPMTDNELLSLASAVEAQSAHPLAEAIVRETKTRNLIIPRANAVQSETGVGVSAQVEDKDISIRKLSGAAAKDNLPSPLYESARSLEREGKTVIQVVIDGDPMGLIALSDEIRPEARNTISALRDLGIQRVVMISGDNAQAATHIGNALDVDEVRAELMPEEKLEFIDDLVSLSSNVAMIGDGVNDAPALAAASTGIAMGGAKTHVALESSDVVLMADDLSALPFAIELSEQTRRIIRQNFILALAVIGGLIALTLANLAGITLAIIVHEGSTLLVVFNALRLLGFRPKGSLSETLE